MWNTLQYANTFIYSPLTADERATLETGLRSPSTFTVRRCQILLASAEGQATTTIAHDLRCTIQTVRNTALSPS
jgi:DNA-binding NarL/FixJ family response regulator